MSPPTPSTPLTGIRLSSVVPAQVTGESNKDYKLTNMDLALKLHYIKGVYLFSAEAVEGLTMYDLKKPMFPLLHLYYTASGRIRRSESGRPFVKCNDSGVRIVEATCDKTLEEWMDQNGDDSFLLAHDQVLGPDLGFSPLVYVQFTRFKCGGMSVGLSWAHVLGDPFSASTFINRWAQFINDQLPSKPLHHVSNPEKPECPPSIFRKPFSTKRIDPVGDYWLTTNNCKMETHSFHFTANQLDNLVSGLEISDVIQLANNSHFEVISAIIWKSLSKIREDGGPRIVTICKRASCNNLENEVPSNRMAFSIVRADFLAAKGGVDELAKLIAEEQEKDNGLIEEFVGGDNGDQLDYMVYGTNLTFINMEEANIYGLKLNGHEPAFANHTINGVGDEGVALVLPTRRGDGGYEKRSGGRRVTVTLPVNQLKELKNVLRQEWGII